MNMRSFLSLVVLAVVVVLSNQPASSAAEQSGNAPYDVVQKAMDSYETWLHGIVGMQRHFTTVIDAGIARHSEESDSGLLIQNGVFRQAHYYKITRDGKEFTQQQLADRDAQTNKGWASGKIFFKEPYDARFFGDYQFTSAPPCNCGSDMIAIAFSSSQHDDQHGSGTMWIDSSDYHVVKLTYTPYVLPPHATSGSVTETTAEVLPNLWYVVRIDETYQGHALFLRGTGTFTALIDHFQRFATVAEGENAIENGKLGGVASR
jgi:hypothetical protein